MSNMSNQVLGSEIDPIRELEQAGDLYSQYLEISGVNSVPKVNQRPSYMAPLPAPMTLTFV